MVANTEKRNFDPPSIYFSLLGVLSLLKYLCRLFEIVNITFKPGSTSNCIEVFTNMNEIAFPSTKKEQCYTHIM